MMEYGRRSTPLVLMPAKASTDATDEIIRKTT